MSADQLNSFLEKLDLLCAKLKEEDCPICDLRLAENRTNCANGHGICASCKSVVNICPQCSANYPGDVDRGIINNQSNDTHGVNGNTVEEVGGQVLDRKKCINAVRGCQTCLPEGEIQDHEDSCTFRSYVCKICSVDMCMRKLRGHCERFHKADVIKNSTFHVVKDNETQNGSKYYFIEAHNEHFWFWRNNTNIFVFFGLQYLGDVSKSSDYKYTFEVVSKDGKSVMKFGGPVLFDTLEPPRYGPSEDYMMLAKNFLSSGGKFKLTVHKV